MTGIDTYMAEIERKLLAAYRPRWWRRPEALLFLATLRHDTARLLDEAWIYAARARADANALAAERGQLAAELADAERALDMYRREPAVTRESELARLREGIQPWPLGQDTAREPAPATEHPPEAPRTAPEPRTGVAVGMGTAERQEGSQSREEAP